ncbi:MAG: DUF2069 domain-containing protein [Aestuariibacter sp.]
MASKTRFFRLLALFSYTGLLVWVITWHFLLSANQQYSNVFLFLFWVLPLLFPMVGMFKGKPYTHAWANFIVMIYLLHSLTAIYTETDEWWYALIELVLATSMFIGCSYYAKFRGRELGLGLKKLSESE